MDAKTRQQIDRELELISELGYESYFLTVHDIVRFARSRSILCQGRGSAANSAVCFALGITEINPSLMNMLFERFLSRERNEPPDIDVDFEHERREEVLQIRVPALRPHPRSADGGGQQLPRSRRGARCGQGPGFAAGPGQCPGRVLRALERRKRRHLERLREAGFDPDSPLLRRVLALTQQLIGFPGTCPSTPAAL